MFVRIEVREVRGSNMRELVLIYLVVINLILFCLMGVDKLKAIHHLWRIPEKVLLTLGVIGGGIFGFVSMFLFHHKSRKIYFKICFAIGVVVAALLIKGVIL
jgi:uncharacterized membrane protein YsdA (DUF1294 family)